jgi:hypothetical protein
LINAILDLAKVEAGPHRDQPRETELVRCRTLGRTIEPLVGDTLVTKQFDDIFRPWWSTTKNCGRSSQSTEQRGEVHAGG